MTYQHKEAFCLMTYACKCGHQERIWNSRDGVTPFGAQCPSCDDGIMHHTDWALDRCVPAHQLRPGQKFWRDGTLEEARDIVLRRIIAHDRSRKVDTSPSRIAELVKGISENEEGEFQKGWPMLDVSGRQPA